MYKQRLQAIAREASFPIDSYGADHFVLTQEMIGELRLLNYMDRWKLAIEKGWYHVKMQDHSIFHFSEGTSPSYSYLHCPIEVVSFPEYLDSVGKQNTPSVRREMFDAYQQVFDTARSREHVTPIRFDYDVRAYAAGVHPVAHIHIGLDNQVRIGSNRMSAVSFVLFVMRHMYPESWRRLLQRKGVDGFVSSIRDPSTRISDEFWSEKDRIELHFA